MSGAGNLLFVYGTLMTSARGELGADMRARLKEVSTSLGEAAIAGRLFDMGRYPVMIAPESSSDIVHGELLRLDDPESVFVWLDPYEGFVPGQPRENEYERVRRPIQRPDGGTVEAWVYLYVADASGLPAVPSGRWGG